MLLVGLFNIEQISFREQMFPCQTVPKGGPECDKSVNGLADASVVFFKTSVDLFIYFLKVLPGSFAPLADDFTSFYQ